jgi:hypothetical protein
VDGGILSRASVVSRVGIGSDVSGSDVSMIQKTGRSRFNTPVERRQILVSGFNVRGHVLKHDWTAQLPIRFMPTVLQMSGLLPISAVRSMNQERTGMTLVVEVSSLRWGISI